MKNGFKMACLPIKKFNVAYLLKNKLKVVFPHKRMEAKSVAGDNTPTDELLGGFLQKFKAKVGILAFIGTLSGKLVSVLSKEPENVADVDISTDRSEIKLVSATKRKFVDESNSKLVSETKRKFVDEKTRAEIEGNQSTLNASAGSAITHPRLFKKTFRLAAMTIAEALTVVVLIGLISSLLLPALLNAHSQTQFKTGLKKSVATINNAISLNITKGGKSAYYTNSSYPLIKYLEQNIKTIASLEDSHRNSNNSEFYTKDNLRYEFPKEDKASNEFSGVKIGGDTWEIKNSNCGTMGLEASSTLKAKKTTPCVILVDVNGDLPPNKLTNDTDNSLSDMFLIIVSDMQAIPYGSAAQNAFYDE